MAYRKGIFYIIEQPMSSLLFEYQAVRKLLRRHKAIRVYTALGAYNAPTLKPAPWSVLIKVYVFMILVSLSILFVTFDFSKPQFWFHVEDWNRFRSYCGAQLPSYGTFLDNHAISKGGDYL